jgi:6-phosphogluconolactonase
MRLRAKGSLVTTLAVLLALAATAGPAGAGKGVAGAVYTLSNPAGGNAVLVFSRAPDGTLTPGGSFPTGGLGTGVGLGSQGAVVLSDNGKNLFAVDPGSNELAAFDVKKDQLELVSHVPSGGVMPISVTVHGDLVYVLNGGGAANITGFRFRHGDLVPIAGSTQPLSAAAPGPAQIQFDPHGRVLAVTEKVTNVIDTYTVGKDGVASGPNVFPSAGLTPFGFDFDQRGHLIVSDAFGGAPNASALSSYDVDRDGTLTTITPLEPDGQTAACWVVITKNGRYAYTTNTGSANVSSYTVGHDGSLSLLQGAAGATGMTPIDAALSRDSHYLYTLDAGGQDVSAFEVGHDGALSPIAGAAGLPASAVGLAAQ